MTLCYDRLRCGLIVLSTLLLCTLPFRAPVVVLEPLQITTVDLSPQMTRANLAHLTHLSFSQPYGRLNGLTCDGEIELNLAFKSHYDIDLHFVTESTCQRNYLWSIGADADWSFNKVKELNVTLTGQKFYPGCYLIANSETSYWLKPNTIQLDLEYKCLSANQTSMTVSRLPTTTFTL